MLEAPGEGKVSSIPRRCGGAGLRWCDDGLGCHPLRRRVDAFVADFWHKSARRWIRSGLRASEVGRVPSFGREPRFATKTGSAIIVVFVSVK